MSETRQLDAAVAELIPRALDGDAPAHDALLRRCHGTVFRWALAHTGDPDDAEDVAQEVLVRLVTHLDRFKGRSRFTTWLYQVTRNAARELQRRSSSRRRLGDALTREADETERREDTDLRDEVTALYRDLPPRQREIFHLADLEELTITEIAERLAMNPVTVRVHLFRARRALRTRLLARYPDLAEGRQ